MRAVLPRKGKTLRRSYVPLKSAIRLIWNSSFKQMQFYQRKYMALIIAIQIR